MPSPLTQSIVPQSWLQRAQEALDQRSLDESPVFAGLKGLGAGVLGGISEQLTPVNLGLLATGGLGTAGKALQAVKGLRAAPGLADAAGRSLGASTQVGPVVKGLMRGVPPGAEEAFLKYVSKPW